MFAFRSLGNDRAGEAEFEESTVSEPDSSHVEGFVHEPYEEDGQLVPLVVRQSYSFDGRTNGTQELVIADRVPTTGCSLVYLMIVVHAISAMSFSSLRVVLDNIWVDPDEPQTTFVQRDLLVGPTLGQTSGNPVFTFGVLPISGTIGPMLRARLNYTQGGFFGTREATLSIYLIQRRAGGPKA